MPNTSLDETILEISSNFINEALQSPALLADMAAMEKYLAESYSNRTFIELLQNSDDCKSKRVLVKQVGNDLYFANDGCPFTSQDVISICRSGASSKERGKSIGYRGVGFKSSTHLSDNIIIYSNNTTFTFSREYCSQILNLQKETVPIVRIPFILEHPDKIMKSQIEQILTEKYNTVFIFKNASLSSFEQEIHSINSDSLIFLNNIIECNIDTNNYSKKIICSREKTKDGFNFYTDSESNKYWHIVKGSFSSIAFRIIDGKLCECNENEAVYYSYLPTIDKAPYKIKINSDFSTDPSRKHITIDKLTENSLKDVAHLIYLTLQNALKNNESVEMSDLFLIFQNQISFSSTNSVLTNFLNSALKEMKIYLVHDEVSISKYKLFPSWLEDAEINLLRQNSTYVKNNSLPDYLYKKYIGIDSFISKFSTSSYSTDDFIKILSDESLCKTLSSYTYSKIFSNIIKQAKFENQIMEKTYNIQELSDVLKSNDSNKEIQKSISESLSASEIDWINAHTTLRMSKPKSKSTFETSSNHTIYKSTKPILSKWRSAEQRTVQLEESLGNKAIDVSKSNLGYDIESTTKNGEKRYIEVKSLSNEYSGFCITNNEYTAAHQLSDNFYICLMFENKAIYIQNPLKKLHFEKRIRQWEWLCEEYNGEVIDFNIK